LCWRGRRRLTLAESSDGGRGCREGTGTATDGKIGEQRDTRAGDLEVARGLHTIGFCLL